MKIKHTLYIILLTASLIPLYIFASVMIVQNNKNTKSMMQENLRFISESPYPVSRVFVKPVEIRLI